MLLADEPDAIEEVFTEDVVVWSPNLVTRSRTELQEVISENRDLLSNLELRIDVVDCSGDRATVEWQVSADHTGALLVGDDYLFEPSGRRISIAGAVVAEFRGKLISTLRCYFDDAAVLEQLLT